MIAFISNCLINFSLKFGSILGTHGSFTVFFLRLAINGLKYTVKS